jgi:hypothetical protein
MLAIVSIWLLLGRRSIDHRSSHAVESHAYLNLSRLSSISFEFHGAGGSGTMTFILGGPRPGNTLNRPRSPEQRHRDIPAMLMIMVSEYDIYHLM